MKEKHIPVPGPPGWSSGAAGNSKWPPEVSSGLSLYALASASYRWTMKTGARNVLTMWVPGASFLTTGAAHGCELPHECWELNPEELPVCLADEL